MSFLFSRTFRRKKTPAPIPGGEPLLLFLGLFISQAEKKHSMYGGSIYCIYIMWWSLEKTHYIIYLWWISISI